MKKRMTMTNDSFTGRTPAPERRFGPPSAGPGRRGLLLGGAVAIALVSGATGFALRGAPASAEVAPVETVTNQEFREALATRVEELDAAVVAGQELLDATDAQVADENTRADLRVQVAAAAAVRTSTGDSVGFPQLGDLSVEEAVDAFLPGYSALTVSVSDATSAAAASHDAWAYSELTGAMGAGQASLDASNGQVVDNAVRDSLSAAITTGQGIWDAGEGATLASETLAARDAIATAQTAVDGARAEWARAELGASLQAARPVLDGSSGQVIDNTVRDALYLAINHGQGLWDAGVSGASVTDTLASRDQINTTTSTVQGAVAQWQSQQPQG